jgi:selenocysteine lyase/cysteine desulfurase
LQRENSRHAASACGGDPNKLRLSTPYYLQKKDIDRFLEMFDEYKKVRNA